MNIVTPQVSDYLDSLYQPVDSFLVQLRQRAEEDHVPIILRDTERLLVSLLQLKKPKKILEIGTAVGYSSIFFAKVCEEAVVTTLEVSEESAAMARENIEKAGLSHRITVLVGDGRDTLLELQSQGGNTTFDCVFIDAAKGQYQIFWDHCQPLWTRDVMIVSDNVLFKGMTASDDFINNRRNKTIVRRMREYLDHITNLEDVQTTVLAVGDGVAISMLK